MVAPADTSVRSLISISLNGAGPTMGERSLQVTTNIVYAICNHGQLGRQCLEQNPSPLLFQAE